MDSSYFINIFLLSRLLCRMDRPRADNMKFISLAALCIITQVYLMSISRAVPLEHNVIVDEAGKRYLPLVISIDEPEMHSIPICSGRFCIITSSSSTMKTRSSARFSRICSGLRSAGPLFIVTHSTDSLIDDYRHIIRLYRNKQGLVKAACGAGFHFSEEIEKHLIMHFPEVKEALYSRSVLIVEGETEYGCFQHFGKTLDLPFDYYASASSMPAAKVPFPRSRSSWNTSRFPSSPSTTPTSRAATRANGASTSPMKSALKWTWPRL